MGNWAKKYWWVLCIVVAVLALAGLTAGIWQIKSDVTVVENGNVTFYPAGFLPPRASDSFKTMNCPFGTNPVANTATTTLNWTSDDATVTITGNSGTRTIDFSAAGASGDGYGQIVGTSGNCTATTPTERVDFTSSDGSMIIEVAEPPPTPPNYDTVDFTIAPRIRWIQVLGSSWTGNTTNGFTAAADVVFGNHTYTVPQFSKDSTQYGEFHCRLPSDFGAGGNTTPRFWFSCINSAATGGGVYAELKLATTEDDLAGATPQGANITWVENDEPYPVAQVFSPPITIAGSPVAGAQLLWEFYIVQSPSSTIDEHPYLFEVGLEYMGY